MSHNISISTIVAKIKRLDIKGGATNFFDKLDFNIREVIENNIELHNDEKFILCYYLNTDYWWVITNLRLLISENEQIESYLFDSIKTVEAKDIFERGISNQECDRLQLILQNEQEKNLNLENNTWFSVLNLLKFLLNKG
ncbi:MAG TPA: hypothetical protein DCR77_01660 [Flavobacteriaceae bacterium]|nr:hypothetical protein [Flavobacteriaceae bacterium]